MAGTFRIGGKVLATHDSGTDEISLDSATNTSNMSFDANHAGIKTALNASGDAPIYACRAWVNFNGTLDENQLSLTTGENVYIRDAGNVSSVYFNGTGNYTINFEIPMPDTNYSVNFMGSNRVPNLGDAGSCGIVDQPGSNFTTSSFRVATKNVEGNNSGLAIDLSVVNVTVFR